MRLMKLQPFFRRHATRLRLGVEAVYRAQRLQYMLALLRKALSYFSKLTPPVRHAVAKQDFDSCQLRRVPRQRVTHLDGRRKAGLSLLQHVTEIFACVLRTGEVKRDLLFTADRHNATGKRTRAFLA